MSEYFLQVSLLECHVEKKGRVYNILKCYFPIGSKTISYESPGILSRRQSLSFPGKTTN